MITVGPIVPTSCVTTRLAALHARAFERSARPWTANEIKTLASASGATLIAERSRDPLGFALFRQVLDEAELLTICVEPCQRNKGVGRALMRYSKVFLRANRCAVIFLEVNEANRAALSVYNRAGFLPVGYRKEYYGAGNSGCALSLACHL